MKWRIGCSGFHYKHWKKVFYPDKLPQRLWFEYYSSKFETVELNVTFYRFPQVSFLKSWYERSPSGFKFSVKVPRLITHFKKLNDSGDLLKSFYDTVTEGLGNKLGCILFQFPPTFQYSEEHLERIIESTDRSFLNVTEFRHESWWNPEVYRRLKKNKLIFCGMSHPLLPDDIVETSNVIYYRFHGVSQLYGSPYTEKELRHFSRQLKRLEKVKTAWVYFNNGLNASALRNAGFLIHHTQSGK